MSHAEGDYRIAALVEWGYSPGPDLVVPCVYCSTMGNYALHHIVFRGQGGENDPANLAPLCITHHEAVHSERVQLSRVVEHGHDGLYRAFILSWENGAVSARTPWPPNVVDHKLMGVAMSSIRERLTYINEALPYLIAPQLTEVAVGLQDRRNEVERVLAHAAYERMIRTPRRDRARAAKAVASEWGDAGYQTSEGDVRNMAKRWIVMGSLPDELWDELPASIRRYAADHVRLEEGADTDRALRVVSDWQERPESPGGKPQSTIAFIRARQRGQTENICGECGGSGTVTCPRCGGSGQQP